MLIQYIKHIKKLLKTLDNILKKSIYTVCQKEKFM